MKKGKLLAFVTVFAVVAVAAFLIAAPPIAGQSVPSASAGVQQCGPDQLALGAACYPPIPPWWIGYNKNLSKYYVAPGYPAYTAHPRYLGKLKGSWHDIGVQYGQKAGDLVRLVYEGGVPGADRHPRNKPKHD